MNEKAVIFTFVILMLALIASNASANIIYVDATSSLGGDGQTWSTAYKYLQDAFAASEYGDEVWVAEGTYTPDANSLIPDGSGDRAATFRLKNGIALYGGFPSGGGTLPIRDPNRYETILSGDLDENDEPVPYPKDLLSHFSRAENSYTVVKNIGTAGYAILDGFIITAGQSDGGIFNFESCLTIANCRLVNNSASYFGGAITNFVNSRLNMTNCIITGNSTNREGGAISNIGDSDLTLINCVISDNFANRNGGGIVNESGTVTLDGCTFTNNWAEGAGGAVLGSWGSSSSLSLTATACVFNANSAGNIGGGGIYWSPSSEYSEMLLTDCTFTENSVRGTGEFANGGGILAEGLNSVILTNCTFIGNSVSEGVGGGFYNSYSLDSEFTDCTFVGNSAYWGAGLYNLNSSPEITNCTFSNNTAQVAGGAMENYEHSSPTVTNCTFNGNSANNEDHGSTGWGGAVANFHGASPTVANCAFRNNFAGEFGGAISNSDATIIENCIFTGNSTYYKGGAMYNNFREGNITVTNCLFTANTAYWGGGMHNYGSHPIITNCTFAQNRATQGDALGCEDGSSIELTNCILWDGQDQIHYPDSLLITITYSDVQGGWPDVGNISADPLFIDPNGPDSILGTEDDNFRLIGDSPCIDVGDNLIVDPNAKDLDGNQRISDGDGDGVAVVDMGTYEFFHANTAPVAEAGANQTVYACADGMAEVKLDGSGSFDADGDELDYFWFEGVEQIATGVDPNVQLSVGEHIIELIVNDGSEDSEPNAVVITVIEPIEADVHIVPRVINRRSRMKRVMAIIRLPEGIGKGDVVRESFELYAGGLDSEPIGAIWERVIGWGNMTRVFALFDKAELMAVVGSVDSVDLTVVGRLESGQCIYGSDTVRIVQPRRRPRKRLKLR